MKLIKIIALLVCFVSIAPKAVNGRSLDSTKWQKMSEKFDYPPPTPKEKKTEKKKEQKSEKSTKKTKPSKSSNSSFKGLPIGNALLYIGIIALIGLLIYILVQADVIKVGKRNVQLKTTFDVDNPEELVLTELQMELQEAEANSNYNRCLRYEFLLLLEKLQSLGLIRWHKHNTNGDYLNQLLNYTFYKRIRTLTVVYEYYWYGEHTLKVDEFNKLTVAFEQLRKEMDNE